MAMDENSYLIITEYSHNNLNTGKISFENYRMYLVSNDGRQTET
jgi:hypothetical protein